MQEVSSNFGESGFLKERAVQSGALTLYFVSTCGRERAKMKILWSWLCDHIEPFCTPKEAALFLTRSGTEAIVQTPYPWAANFCVAEVLKVTPHPHAHALQICTVAQGRRPVLSLVCGASNVRPGLKTLLAVPGCELPGDKKPLGAATLRGVVSEGMLCSAQELWMEDLFSGDGILELPEDSLVGSSLQDLLPQDDLLVLEVTFNRGDLLSHLGVARELIALGLGRRKETSTLSPLSWMESIIVQDKGCQSISLCTLEGVEQGKTPALMRRRLWTVGVSCHFPCVDLTNYIAEDRGQPLHVFDGEAMEGEVMVRTSSHGEIFETLENQKVILPQGLMVVADERGILSLAGIMGGKRGKCTAHSRKVVVEAASFFPERIARAGRLTGIESASRVRFERGVDPEQAKQGLRAAVAWMQTHSGGTPTLSKTGGVACISPLGIPFDFGQVERLGGALLAPAIIQSRLEALGAQVHRKDASMDGAIHSIVFPPSWRPDWKIPQDCVEEVLRLDGYEEVISTPLHGPCLRIQDQENTEIALPSLQYLLLRQLRVFFVHQGLFEVVTWSFLSSSQSASFFQEIYKDLLIQNPISQTMDFLRPCLLPSLMDLEAYHRKYNLSFFPIFEIGPQFSGLMPGDQEQVCAALFPASFSLLRIHPWQRKEGEEPFFAVKAMVDLLLQALGIADYHWERGEVPWSHPGKCAQIRQGSKGVTLGVLGELHPRLNSDAVGCELYLNHFPLPKKRERYSVPSLQPVTKDLSFFLASGSSEVGPVMEALTHDGPPSLVQVQLMDCFKETERSSITVRCTFQPIAQAFSGQELQDLMEKVVELGKKVGAELRGTLRGSV